LFYSSVLVKDDFFDSIEIVEPECDVIAIVSDSIFLGEFFDLVNRIKNTCEALASAIIVGSGKNSENGRLIAFGTDEIRGKHGD
jgi:hypothetical protein